MALTYSTLARDSIGDAWMVRLKITPGSSDYPTKGWILDTTANGALPLGEIFAVIPIGIATTDMTTAIQLQYNYTTGGLQAFESAGSATVNPEVGNGADLSTYIFELLVIGK